MSECNRFYILLPFLVWFKLLYWTSFFPLKEKLQRENFGLSILSSSVKRQHWKTTFITFVLIHWSHSVCWSIFHIVGFFWTIFPIFFSEFHGRRHLGIEPNKNCIDFIPFFSLFLLLMHFTSKLSSNTLLSIRLFMNSWYFLYKMHQKQKDRKQLYEIF